MDMFNTPVDSSNITKPDFYDDAERLKQVGLFPNTHHYQIVNNYFLKARQEWRYCQLAIWLDDHWCLFYATSKTWPLDQAPYREFLIQAYRASKHRDCHYFDLLSGRPWNDQKYAA